MSATVNFHAAKNVEFFLRRAINKGKQRWISVESGDDAVGVFVTDMTIEAVDALIDSIEDLEFAVRQWNNGRKQEENEDLDGLESDN